MLRSMNDASVVNSTHSSRKQPVQSSFRWIYVLHAIALSGLSLSILLTQHFYDVHNGTAGFQSSCNINETFNCDIVTASPYSELIASLPISGFAAGWFLALFLFSLIAHNRFWRREALRGCFGLTALAILIQVPYVLIMAYQLKTYCLYCLGIDGLNFLGLGAIFMLRPEGISQNQPQSKPNWGQWKTLASILAASVLITVFGLKAMLDQMHFPASEIAETAKSILDTPPISVQTEGVFPFIGPEKAPITIVEFSDFQCPYCKVAAFTLHYVAERYPHQIKIVFRNFPLDQTCNSQIPHTAHPVACEAARVALCTQKQGKFEKIYQQLFEHQAAFVPGLPLTLAQKVGANMNALQGCVASPEVNSAIARDVEEANVLGIKSTPTFFINGHRIEGAMPLAVWQQVIHPLLIQLGQKP